MKLRPRVPTRTALGVLVVTALLCAMGAVGTATAAGSVRGFDGSTVKIAGIGIGTNFGKADVGTQARVKRFNDDKEIKGVQISYGGFTDDKQDPAVSLNEVRRLVTQEQVFALVPDLSATNPGDYLRQQHVPYFGWAFDGTYCSTKIDKSLYGFGYNGCLVPQNPSVMGDGGRAAYSFVSQKTGKKHPTLAIFSNDQPSGKLSVSTQSVAYQGAGFDVVAKQNKMPFPVDDFTPYVQALLTSDNGKAPDAIVCLLATDCIATYTMLKANGYAGTYVSSLYSSFLTKAMDGSAANINFVNPSENTAGLRQLKKDVAAVQPDAQIDSGVVASYAATDMFIQALKTIAKKGKSNITPENLQKAAMNQTWKIDGLAGPITYPNSTAAPYPTCNAEVQSDGTAWNTVTPFACSKKQFKVS